MLLCRATSIPVSNACTVGDPCLPVTLQIQSNASNGDSSRDGAYAKKKKKGTMQVDMGNNIQQA